MCDLNLAEDGTYISGNIPFGYTLWGDRLVEVPAELDACVTAIKSVKQQRSFEEIAAAVRQIHGVTLSRPQFDGLMQSLFRRYGPM